MHDAAVVIEEKHRHGEATERVSERCGFDRAQVDDRALFIECSQVLATLSRVLAKGEVSALISCP